MWCYLLWCVAVRRCACCCRCLQLYVVTTCCKYLLSILIVAGCGCCWLLFFAGVRVVVAAVSLFGFACCSCELSLYVINWLLVSLAVCCGCWLLLLVVVVCWCCGSLFVVGCGCAVDVVCCFERLSVFVVGLCCCSCWCWLWLCLLLMFVLMLIGVLALAFVVVYCMLLFIC